MIYTPRNTGRGATCHVAGRGRLDWVLEVDTDEATVTVGAQPFQSTASGEIVTETLKFGTVFPLFGGFKAPIAFVCIP